MKALLAIAISFFCLISYSEVSQQAKDRYRNMSKYANVDVANFFKKKKPKMATLHVNVHKSDILTETTCQQAGRFQGFAAEIIDEKLEGSLDSLCFIYAVKSSAIERQFERFLSDDDRTRCYVLVEKPFVDTFEGGRIINACWIRSFMSESDFDELSGVKKTKGSDDKTSSKPDEDANAQTSGATRTAPGRAGRLTPSNVSPAMFKNVGKPKTTLRAEIRLGSSYYGQFENKKSTHWKVYIEAKNADWSYGESLDGYIPKSSTIAKLLISAIQDGKTHRCLIKVSPVKDEIHDDLVTIDDFEILPSNPESL